MKFEEALAAMREGKKVRRKDWLHWWKAPYMELLPTPEFRIYEAPNTDDLECPLGEADILANDWQIVD